MYLELRTWKGHWFEGQPGAETKAFRPKRGRPLDPVRPGLRPGIAIQLAALASGFTSLRRLHCDERP